MVSLQNLSDDDIDNLLLLLFTGPDRIKLPINSYYIQSAEIAIKDLSEDDLLRIRSKNHPDKWPNANLEIYQAVVEEIDRRRRFLNSRIHPD